MKKMFYILVLLLALQLVMIRVNCETCYTKELYPKMFSDANLTTETWVYSITATDTLK